MKTARSLLALAVPLFLCGCPGDSSDDLCLGVPSPTPAALLLNQPLFRVSAEAAVQVSANLAPTCGADGTGQLPDSVTAEVFDPDNHLVPSSVTLNAGGQGATVRFTPGTAGRHHLLVAFAPVGSLQQFDVYVAREWSGDSAFVELPLPRCAWLDRTERGTWVCDGAALREPGGKPLRLLASTAVPDVAIVGNVLWVVGDGLVRRFVDTGTELELTGSLLLNGAVPVKPIQSRLATENELVVLDGQHLHRFTFADTGVLAAAPPAALPSGGRQRFGLDGVSGVLVRAAVDRVLVVQVEQYPDSLVCPFQLGPDGAFAAADAPCQPLPGTPVGFEENVLWTRTGAASQAQTLYRWVAANGALAEQGSLTLDVSLRTVDEPLRPGFTVPSLHLASGQLPDSALPVAPSAQGPMGLELLPGTNTLPLELRTASPRFYWEGDNRQNSGTTRVYARQSVR